MGKKGSLYKTLYFRKGSEGLIAWLEQEAERQGRKVNDTIIRLLNAAREAAIKEQEKEVSSE